MSRWPRLTPRGQCFGALGLATAAVGMLLGFPDISRIGVLLITLPLLVLVLGVRSQQPLAVDRQARPALAPPGTTVHVRLSIRNSGSRRCAPRLAEEEVPDEQQHPPRFLVPVMEPGEQHVVDYPLRAAGRGRHILGPLRLEQRDPFGLTSRRQPVPGRHEFLVLPHIEDLDDLTRHGAGLGRDGQVPHMISLHGEDDSSIRDYRDGDDLRRVHWPTTAHRGTLMVRQEERPARRRAVLVLDTREAAFATAPAAFEWAVSAIASAAVHLAARGYALHVVGTEQVPATAGLRGVLRALALVEPHAESLSGALREAESLTCDGAVVVAAVGAHDPADTMRLAALRAPGSPATALVVTPDASRDPTPADGLTRVLLESGWHCRATTTDDTVRTAWARAGLAGTGIGGSRR